MVAAKSTNIAKQNQIKQDKLIPIGSGFVGISP